MNKYSWLSGAPVAAVGSLQPKFSNRIKRANLEYKYLRLSFSNIRNVKNGMKQYSIPAI